MKFLLSTQCACLDEEGNAWIFSNEINALFYRKLESGETEYITSFDREEFWRRDLYTDAVWFRGKIFFIPCAAKNIAIYDTLQKTTEYITLDTSSDNYNMVRLPENRILLYPVRESPNAYIVYLEEGCCEYIFIDYGKEKTEIKGKLVRGKAYCKGKAYFIIDKTNQYIMFDINTKTIQICRTEKKVPLFYVASDGEFLYMMHADGCAYDIYNENHYVRTCYLSNQLEKINSNFEFENMEYVINTILEDGSIVSVPMRKQPIVIMKNETVIRFELEDKKIGNYIDDLQPLYVCNYFKNKIVFFPYHGNVLVIINLETAEIVYQSAVIDIMKYDRLFKNIWNRKEKWAVLDEMKVSLEVFLGLVYYCKLNVRAECREIGTKIYKYMVQSNLKGE